MEGRESHSIDNSGGQDPSAPRWQQLFRDLLVPVIVSTFAIGYFAQAHQLSFAALLFPGAVAAILALTIASVVWDAFRSPLPLKRVNVSSGKLRLDILKTVAFVTIALLVPLGWSELGVLPTLWTFVLGLTLILGERSVLLLVLLPAGLALGIVYLFEHVLRIPL